MRPSTQKPRDAGPPRNLPSADEHGGGSSTAQSPQTQRANGCTAGRSWRDVLPVHPAAELFPLMSPDELRELGEDIKNRGLQIPILIRGDELLDGRNRLDAMELVGVPFQLTKEDFGWDLKVGPDQYRVERLFDWSDPYAAVISANIHRQLTAEQKRELIAKLIKAAPEKSDRQIAETVKASPTTVGTVRREPPMRSVPFS